jgi:homoserine kinase
MRLRAGVPASIANLGSGFDCAALALELRNEFLLDTDAEPVVRVEGEGAGELPEGPANLVAKAVAAVAVEAGRTAPPFALTCVNRIPLQRGLGSSASAVVGGLLLGDRLLGANLADEQLLGLAASFEGHADNVAACLLGGLALVFGTSAGWRAERVDPGPSIGPVVLIPEAERLSTDAARRAIPLSVPFQDAAFNVSRSALLTLAFTARPDLLPAALQDRLHQDYRLPLMPKSRSLLDRLHAEGIAACVAGAGPALLALETEGRTVPDPGPGWHLWRAEVAMGGATVAEEPETSPS